MKLSLVPSRQQMADFAERQQTKCTPFSENTGLLLRQYSHLSVIGIVPLDRIVVARGIVARPHHTPARDGVRPCAGVAFFGVFSHRFSSRSTLLLPLLLTICSLFWRSISCIEHIPQRFCFPDAPLPLRRTDTVSIQPSLTLLNTSRLLLS